MISYLHIESLSFRTQLYEDKINYFVWILLQQVQEQVSEVFDTLPVSFMPFYTNEDESTSDV